MPTVSDQDIRALRRRVRAFYAKHGRSLPFRKTTDPYRITVSEIMLQQTQVDRVIPKYASWIKRWPNWPRLAQATPKQLLAEWSGLGYNRRAIYLGTLARRVVADFDGQLPTERRQLLTLPGIGRYTSAAILIFVYNQPLVAIDTNIRRVIIHELKLPDTTTPQEIESLAERLLPWRNARNWHYALMDFSSLALPRRLPTVPPKSKSPKFEGSLRQIRGEIIRQLTKKKSVRYTTVARALQRDLVDVERAAQALERDGLITCTAFSMLLIK